MKCTYELLLVPPSWLFAITSGVHVYIWLPCWHQGNVMLYMCMHAYYISCITKYIKLICMCVYVKKVRIHVYLYRKNWYDDVVNSMLMMHSLQKMNIMICLSISSYSVFSHNIIVWQCERKTEYDEIFVIGYTYVIRPSILSYSVFNHIVILWQCERKPNMMRYLL